MIITRKGVCAATFIILALASRTQAQTYDPHEDAWVPELQGHGADAPDTPASLTSGHPLSSVILVAEDTARDNALSEKTTEAPEAQAASSSRFDMIGADAAWGSYSIMGMRAHYYSAKIPLGYTLTPKDHLLFSIPLNYARYEDCCVELDKNLNPVLRDASVYGYGVSAALTHRFLTGTAKNPWSWSVTPSAGLLLRESPELDMGSCLYTASLSSSLAYRVGTSWIFSLGNSVSFSGASSYRNNISPESGDQTVLVNGVQAVRILGRWRLTAYVMDVRYSGDDELIPSYESYAFSLSYGLGAATDIRLTLIHDEGDQYNSTRVITGTTWRF